MSRAINILGLMSGSSLDGMDIALIRFVPDEKAYQPRIDWLAVDHFEYSQVWKDHLSRLPKLQIDAWMELNVSFSQYVADELRALPFVREAELIAWHGHTSAHRPDQHWTAAVGDPQVLSVAMQLPVIGEFRNKDVALGGQGAPLVTIVDAHYFSDYQAAINLGGIANITQLHPTYRAFDICGCNQVLNAIAEKLGQSMDRDGEISAAGRVDADLRSSLNDWGYLKKEPPRSLDNIQVKQFYTQVLSRENLTPEDAMATAVEHITDAIAAALSCNKPQKILLSGGGAKNIHLVNRLRTKCPDKIIEVAPTPWLDYKEAFLMAYMAYLYEKKENNVFSKMTGSQRDHIAGVKYTF